MQSQSQSQRRLQIVPPLPRSDFHRSLALLVARGWSTSDLFAGLDALDEVRERCATSTPHQVALCLYRDAREAGLLLGGLGTSPWAVRVGILLNSDAETAALMTVADAFRRGSLSAVG